mmetsp:Transcript_34759/g.48386  ORF Transcript_34759/g.48386 Transcript_34759/m.48386 type:complete len:223 (+) Transcript_34759:44-712(+)
MNEGRVEILVDGVWGTVCHRSFERVEAAVVCRELRYVLLTSVAVVCIYFAARPAWLLAVDEDFLQFIILCVGCIVFWRIVKKANRQNSADRTLGPFVTDEEKNSDVKIVRSPDKVQCVPVAVNVQSVAVNVQSVPVAVNVQSVPVVTPIQSFISIVQPVRNRSMGGSSAVSPINLHGQSGQSGAHQLLRKENSLIEQFPPPSHGDASAPPAKGLDGADHDPN